MLARREHSAYELRQKLKQKGFATGEINAVIEQLQRDGWQADDRFAEAYIRSRRNRGYGPQRIAMELQQRGVDEALSAQLMHTDSAEWSHMLAQVYQSKYQGRGIEDFADKAGRMRFLQYRGFSMDAINQLLKHVK
jgi:regulatory protein